MMRAMTGHRPWFKVWRKGVVKSVAPFPHQSVFTLLADAAAGFPDSTAIAFLGKHMSYAQLLREVEAFSAVLAGLGV
jgi:acyl-CoA synthetase (AMP-forming)/AMP-acid ligase II